MRRSLYLGDTVYEVIAEPGFEVRVTLVSKESNYRRDDLGRSARICWISSSHV